MTEEFVVLDNGAEDCLRSPARRSLTPSDRVFLVRTSGPAGEVASAIRELGFALRVYRRLPLIEVHATAADVERLSAVAGVASVVSALGSLDASRKVANGVDLLLAAAMTQNASGGPWLHPGRSAGSRRGYPVFVDGELLEDATIDWPARPALLPVLNMSLGPKSAKFPPLRNDLVMIATHAAAEAGLLVVVAAGNCGEVGPGSMSPWATPEWVLSVGASDDDGTSLAPYSSRGRRGEPESGPDLVAGGRSGLHPPRWGTSFAAPRVTRLAIAVFIAFMQLAREVSLQRGGPPVGVPVVGWALIDEFDDEIWRPQDHAFPGLQALPVGGVDPAAVTACLDVVDAAGWRLAVAGSADRVRAVLLDAARPMAGYERHEVGAGFVDQALVLERLAAFTGEDLVAMFGEGDRPLSTDELSRLRAMNIFERDHLTTYFLLADKGAHAWRYDFVTERFSISPGDPSAFPEISEESRLVGIPAPSPELIFPA